MRVAFMATNLALDDALINAAQQIGNHPTKGAAVNAALEEYIQRRKRLEILNPFGTVDFNPDYDYQANRKLDWQELDRL